MNIFTDIWNQHMAECHCQHMCQVSQYETRHKRETHCHEYHSALLRFMGKRGVSALHFFPLLLQWLIFFYSIYRPFTGPSPGPICAAVPFFMSCWWPPLMVMLATPDAMLFPGECWEPPSCPEFMWSWWSILRWFQSVELKQKTVIRG